MPAHCLLCVITCSSNGHPATSRHLTPSLLTTLPTNRHVQVLQLGKVEYARTLVIAPKYGPGMDNPLELRAFIGTIPAEVEVQGRRYGFACATCHMERPSHYTVSDFREGGSHARADS